MDQSDRIQHNCKFIRMNRALTVLIVGGLLSSCGLFQKTPAPPEPAPIPLSEIPYSVSIALDANADINTDGNGRPSPVRVRVFLVEPEVELKNKTFNEIFDYDGGEIDPGPKANFAIKPGEQKTISVTGNKSESKLVLAAGFREPYKTIWITEKTIDVHTETSVNAAVTRSAVEFGNIQ